MSTIPASTLVSVNPSVLGAGGTGVNGVGLMLTSNSRVPAGTVQSFITQSAVASYFGASSDEAFEAAIYFAGYVNASILPSSLLFAQYNASAVAAYLRGGNVSGLSLAQLQAISGTLNITVDGYPRSGAVNLSATTSFSNAASLIQTALNASLPQEAAVTGSIAPAAATSFTASIAGNVMAVTAVASGTIVTGGTISGTGVTANTVIAGQLSGTPGGIGTYAVNIAQTVASEAGITETYGVLTVTAAGTPGLAVGQTIVGASAGTQITQLGSGTGGLGTYYLNNSQTVGSGALTSSATPLTVSFDSVSGGFVVSSGVVGAASIIAFAAGTPAISLDLTSATGAVLSQGAAPAVPATFMNALVIANPAWANFMTLFDPDGGSGNAQKQAFAAWKNTQSNRFGYVCWDPDQSPAASSNAASSLGQILKGNNDSGTLLVWEGGATTDRLGGGLAAFALGVAASINFNAANGRITYAFKAEAGLVANVTDPTTAGDLIANGYNFYGAYGAATQNFVWFQNGQCTGPYAWFDAYQNQIWLNTSFQVALLNLLGNVGSVPFSTDGASLIQAACQSVIQAGLSFRAFGPRSMTAAQIAEVNAAAGGVNIASALQSNGYYLLANLPAASVRAARGPWSVIFFYLDQGAVQSVNLSSILVQ